MKLLCCFVVTVVMAASMSVEAMPSSREDEVMPLQRAITYTDPSVPLKFVAKAKKKPRRKNLKVTKLLKKMGTDFNTHWMSIEPPSEAERKKVHMSDSQMAELVRQVTSLNLEEELRELEGRDAINYIDSVEDDEGVDDDDDDDDDDDYFESDEVEDDQSQNHKNQYSLTSKSTSGTAQHSSIDSKAIAIFQQWLVQKSSCPVTYEWEDLGEYFWPRWIKKGHCSGEVTSTVVKSEVGCSWPHGMKCVAGKATTLHLLRWHCQRRRRVGPNGKRKSKLHCKWYKVPYPVTSSCKCACQ